MRKPVHFVPLWLAGLIILAACAPASLPADIPSVNPPAAATVEAPPADTVMPASVNPGYRIVDTGQHRCYNNSQEISCPGEGERFYGQDAHYAGVQPSYVNNGDGTVSDLNTGLMWQQDPGSKISYDEAMAKASAFDLGGYSDWRMPTIKELYSLILFSGTDPPPESTAGNAVPFIDTDYFNFKYGDATIGERVIDSQYISGTKYVSTTMDGNETAFGVNFADGRIKGYGLRNPRTRQDKKFYVIYVRGNTEYGTNDFTDNGDGTVTDIATGLMWSKADSGEGMDWEDALAWVQHKNEENYLGYGDWRLPNAKELQSIVDYTRSPDTTRSAAINPVFSTTAIIDEGGTTNYPFYWTGTTHASAMGGGSTAVYIAFGEALGYMQAPPNSGTYQLLDVHGAGAQRSDPKAGNPDDYPHGRGPQGDTIRVHNMARCVRDAAGTPTAEAPVTGAPAPAPTPVSSHGPCPGYTVYCTAGARTGQNTVLLDMDGETVHSWPISGMPVKVLADGSLLGSLRMRQGTAPTGGGAPAPYQDTIELVQVGWDGREQWSFTDWDDDGTGVMMSRQHHDYQRQGNPVGYYAPGQEFLAQGDTLVLAHLNRMVSEISDHVLRDDVIYEVAWDGQLTGFTWQAGDHFPDYGFDADAKAAIRATVPPDSGDGSFDWLHLNSMSQLGKNRWHDLSGDKRFAPENLIISSRNAGFIAIISRETGNIVWRVGPDYGEDQPEHVLGPVVGPHHAHMIPDGLPGAGNILVFDNGGRSGYGEPGGEPKYRRSYTRVIEFNPMTLELVWQYGAASGAEFLFSRDNSSAQRLPNGNTLITDGPGGRIFEVTVEKEVVWEFTAPSTGGKTPTIYRAYRVPPEWVPGNPAGYRRWDSLYDLK